MQSLTPMVIPISILMHTRPNFSTQLSNGWFQHYPHVAEFGREDQRVQPTPFTYGDVSGSCNGRGYLLGHEVGETKMNPGDITGVMYSTTTLWWPQQWRRGATKNKFVPTKSRRCHCFRVKMHYDGYTRVNVIFRSMVRFRP